MINDTTTITAMTMK